MPAALFTTISSRLHRGFMNVRQIGRMNSAPPSTTPAPLWRRRNAVTFKLLFIAALVLLFQLPLGLVNRLRQERIRYHQPVEQTAGVLMEPGQRGLTTEGATPTEGYRMVERALKHSVLVLALVFAAFFLFETLAGLRLHAVHYGLVGAALCLFIWRCWRWAKCCRRAGRMSGRRWRRHC